MHKLPVATATRLWVALTALMTATAHAQVPNPGAGAVGQTTPGAASGTAPAPAKKQAGRVIYHDPTEAYRAGAYDQALQGFVDMQVDRPDDPAIMLNIGSAHYKLKEYADARKAFEQAVAAGTPQQRTKALYNLGDTAYRQGKLDEAIAYYQATLESNPNHDRAKKNIEFVRDEIRRRHEQAKKQQDKQQQEQQQQQQNGQNQQDPNAQSQSGPQDKPPGEDQQQQQAGQNGNQDSDHDGLTDAQESRGQNKTDPHNPDTDGDGKKDGEEDANKNGRVDPGESDPTKPDQAGKQGAENQGKQGKPEQQGQPGERGAQGRQDGSMSPQEAERYLESVGENRPKNKGNASGSPSRVRNGKDW